MVEPRVVVKIPLNKIKDASNSESSQTEADSDPSPAKKLKVIEPEIELPEAKKIIEEEKKNERLKLVRNICENTTPSSGEKQPFEKYNYEPLPSFSNPIEEKEPSPKKSGTSEHKIEEQLPSPESNPGPKVKKTEFKIEPETDGKWLYCQIPGCPFWTRKQIRMERHEKSHIPGEDKFYQCPECKLKICSLSKLLRHDRKFHTGFKDYECKICEAEVTDIAVHMRVSPFWFMLKYRAKIQIESVQDSVLSNGQKQKAYFCAKIQIEK